ncbi:MAG: MATE family efflux transporter [Spirochaetes bacterium]|nr:MATE family efflux transporter [Spirochaetota bacterium]
MDRNAKRLGEEPILKLLVGFSAPAIVGTIVTSMYSVIDRAFVGQVVGPLAIAGMGLTFPISLVLMAFGMLIGIGTSARVSIHLGQRNVEGAERILGNAFTLILCASLALSVTGLALLDPILSLFGSSPDTLPFARQFISIILLGTLFQFVGFGLNGVIGAEGHPRIAMMTMLLNAAVNIVLLVLFVYVLGWGVRGSALATLIAQASSAAWVFLFLRSPRSMLKIRLRNMRLDRAIVMGIVSIGMAPFAMQLAGSFVNAILNRGLKEYGGDMAVGAMSAIFSLAMLLVMPVIGINHGMQPIAGYNFGARRPDRVIRTLKLAMIGATIHLMVMYACIMAFPHFFIRIFSEDPGLVETGTRGIRLFLLALPFVGVQILGANFFLAIGRAGMSLILNLLRQLIILIPALLTLPRFFGLDGVWIAIPFADFLAFCVTGAFVLRETRRLKSARPSAPSATRELSPEEMEHYGVVDTEEYPLQG